MRTRSLLVVTFVLSLAGCTGHVASSRSGLSASRDPSDTLGDAMRKNVPALIGKDDWFSPVVVSKRAPLASADLSLAVAWDPSQVSAGFALARDTRSIPSTTNPSFPRRPSFLYPDDGCFVRAEYMAYELAQAGYPRPAKIFVFGQLSVQTANSPTGSVSWWYHVAPIISVAGQLLVIDPSIEPTQPLALTDWIGRQTTVDGAQVSLCNPFAYTPDGRCSPNALDDQDAHDSAMSSQDTYLDQEWQRQLDLSRDPNQVLGDHPPWTN